MPSYRHLGILEKGVQIVPTNDKNGQPFTNKALKSRINQINNIIGRANLEIYGTDRNSDVDELNNKFHNILKSEMNGMVGREDGDITSFLSKMVSSDSKTTAIDELLNNQFSQSFGGNMQSIQSFFYDKYRNKILEQSDLNQIADNLIELSEAIEIMRDAIVSSNVNDGTIARTLDFEGSDDDNYKDIVEKLEEKFDLVHKIKNFIVPNTLKYGEYYVYIVPYSKIFQDFMKQKEKSESLFYRESTIASSFNDKKKKNASKEFYSKVYKEFREDNKELYESAQNLDKSDANYMPNETEFIKEFETICENISICNSPIPLPVLEEGFASMEEFMDLYINEAGDNTNPTKKGDTPKTQEDLFSKFNSSEGIISDSKGTKKNPKNEFADIKDCYMKCIEPLKVIEMKIMDSVIGYYYVQDDDLTTIASGSYNNGLYFTKFSDRVNNRSIIDNLCEVIVKQFDRKFLKENSNFKKQIADCINYYNFSEKKLNFQFIPVEYMVPFKIDVNEVGEGQSMLKKSLFYAKLYLMLLLFKILSIVLYSNDQKVNYIRQSGIDKNISNRIEEIARIKQSRQINIMDMFSYTTLINKVGSGNELNIPVGRSNERPIETEILQGQEIQLNSELLEMLKNAYILGTGVPQAILNYLNEAEFAKVVEQNNTKMNGRVVGYQIDFNNPITRMYKKIMTYSTNIDESIIDNFKFVFQAPKITSGNTKADAIQAFQTYSDFIKSIMYDKEDNLNEKHMLEVREFIQLLAEDQLPMLNFEVIRELMADAKAKAVEDKLTPSPEVGDDDLDEDLNSIPDEG